MITPDQGALYKLPIELSVAQREITELRARVAELEADRDLWREAKEAVEKDVDREYKRAEAAEAELARRGQVQVKPLDWKTQGKNHFSLAIGLTYLVTHDFDGWHVLIVIGREMTGVVDGAFPTLEAAKAAAQADYESRIREAIVSPGDGVAHASDCAVHNAPAYPPGPCDCGAAPPASEGAS
jgi:hypothetical protein